MWLLATHNIVKGSFESGARPAREDHEGTLEEFAAAYFGDADGEAFVECCTQRRRLIKARSAQIKV